MIAPSDHLLEFPAVHRGLFVHEPLVATNLLDKQEAIYASKIVSYNRSSSVRTNLVEVFTNAVRDFHDTVSRYTLYHQFIHLNSQLVSETKPELNNIEETTYNKKQYLD